MPRAFRPRRQSHKREDAPKSALPVETDPSRLTAVARGPAAAMRPNLLSIEVRGFVNAGRWGDRCDDFAVIQWRLHRLKVAFTLAHDVEGDAHGVRKGFGLAPGFVFGHEAACPPPLSGWPVNGLVACPVPWALVKRYPNSPACISAAIRAWECPPPAGSALPEALEPISRQLGVPDGVLNVPVPEVVQEGTRVPPVVGQA